jgi:hypothetical protein
LSVFFEVILKDSTMSSNLDLMSFFYKEMSQVPVLFGIHVSERLYGQLWDLHSLGSCATLPSAPLLEQERQRVFVSITLTRG